jgi:HK97 family phage major capsid protein/HK97 family phage prohead protease
MTDDLIAAVPPREGYRAISLSPEYRETANQPPRLVGHFARFNVFNEIDSAIEGRFLERIDPQAFTRTFKNNRDRIRVLFQHGKDPHIGDKPIATITDLRSDTTGPRYEAEVFDGIDPLVMAGLRAGQYGVSYRFRVVREDYVSQPGRSDLNPLGLPERTINEAEVYEFGPVTFPADAGADIMVRSLSDEMTTPTEPVAPSPEPEADAPHPEPEARDEPEPVTDSKENQVPPDISTYVTRDDKAARVDEILREMETINKQFDGVLPAEPQARWDGYVEEKKALLDAIDAIDQRRRDLETAWTGRQTLTPREQARTVESPQVVNIIKSRDLDSIYDVQRMTRESRNRQDLSRSLHDNAMRAVEGATFSTTERAKGQGEIESLLKGVDYVDPDEAAKRVLFTGSPSYRRAYRKYLTQGPAGPMFSAEEANAFEESRTALVTASNVAVPFDLDSTMVINTSGAINPYRQAFRVVKTTSNDWRPLVSSGMTAVYEDEATAATDLSPAFTAPQRLLVKAHTAATFSVEIQGDYPGLETEIAKEIADAKDVLEATQFGTGVGTTHFPLGIFTYYTANFLDTATTLVIVPQDLYKLEANVGPRYRGNCVWLGSPFFYGLVRSIDTAGGAGLWVDNLSLPGSTGTIENGRLGNLLGHPAYECVAPANASMATTEKVAILANRDRFVIIDRVGMNIELIPNFLDATTGLPTGQRMLYAWWRNTSTGIGLATLGAGRSSCIFRGK